MDKIKVTYRNGLPSKSFIYKVLILKTMRLYRIKKNHIYKDILLQPKQELY